MEATPAGLLQRGQPQRRLADTRFALDEQARRLIVHRRDEISYRAELRRTTDNCLGHEPMMTVSKQILSENDSCRGHRACSHGGTPTDVRLFRCHRRARGFLT